MRRPRPLRRALTATAATLLVITAAAHSAPPAQAPTPAIPGDDCILHTVDTYPETAALGLVLCPTDTGTATPWRPTPNTP